MKKTEKIITASAISIAVILICLEGITNLFNEGQFLTAESLLSALAAGIIYLLGIRIYFSKYKMISVITLIAIAAILNLLLEDKLREICNGDIIMFNLLCIIYICAFWPLAFRHAKWLNEEETINLLSESEK